MQTSYDPADYMYYEEYELAKQTRLKPTIPAHQPGKVQHSGPPLDFSFLKLQDILALKKERQRAGKRKEIEKDEDEEDAKKGDQLAVNDDKDNGDKPKEQREAGVTVTKASHIPDISNLLSKNNAPL